MAWVSSAVGGALGTIGTIGANLDSDRARSQLLALGGQDPSYTTSPYASQTQGLAANLLNAKMPGATEFERNIYGSQANAVNSDARGATSGSQFLASAAGAQGQTNQQFQNLSVQQQQDYYNRLGNLNQANQGMTNELDKGYQDRVRKWQDSVNILMGRNAMKQGEWQNMTNLGGMISGMGGGMGGAKGGGGGGMGGGGGGGGM